MRVFSSQLETATPIPQWKAPGDSHTVEAMVCIEGAEPYCLARISEVVCLPVGGVISAVNNAVRTRQRQRHAKFVSWETGGKFTCMYVCTCIRGYVCMSHVCMFVCLSV